MKQTILYVELYVDDTHDHGSALSQETGEVLNVQCRPTLKGLINQLINLCNPFPGYTIHVAYEAIEASSDRLKVNLSLLRRQLQSLNTALTEHDQEIESLAKTLRYPCQDIAL